MEADVINALLGMAHSPVQNYVIPGLTSYLIGNPGPTGAVRLFRNERDHQESIAPHSHRFDFRCFVVGGWVTNRIWLPCGDTSGDLYMTSELQYRGDIGRYEKVPGASKRWRHADKSYFKGESYSMKADEVHSIKFSRGAVVLFFEGPQVSDTSILLEPFVGGETVPTGQVQPWMFRREAIPQLFTEES